VREWERSADEQMLLVAELMRLIGMPQGSILLFVNLGLQEPAWAWFALIRFGGSNLNMFTAKICTYGSSTPWGRRTKEEEKRKDAISYLGSVVNVSPYSSSHMNCLVEPTCFLNLQDPIFVKLIFTLV
jgi:hypothetical protein